MAAPDKSNSVERVRAALLQAGHADTIAMFPDGTRTAQDAANAVGCTVAQIVKSIVLRAGERPLLVLTSGANRVDVEENLRRGRRAGSARRRALGARQHGLCHRRRRAGRPRQRYAHFHRRRFVGARSGLGGGRLAAPRLPHQRQELARLTGGEIAEWEE